MTQELKDVRECDVNGTQVIICDVLEAGAVLPHSILLDEYLNPTWEEDADAVANMVDTAQAEECTCIFSKFGGTNMNSEYCPVHDKKSTWQLNAIAEEADAKDWQDQTTQLRNGG